MVLRTQLKKSWTILHFFSICQQQNHVKQFWGIPWHPQRKLKSPDHAYGSKVEERKHVKQWYLMSKIKPISETQSKSIQWRRSFLYLTIAACSSITYQYNSLASYSTGGTPCRYRRIWGLQKHHLSRPNYLWDNFHALKRTYMNTL